jgi:3',5'-nucleoside bisphosphate phosphatase
MSQTCRLRSIASCCAWLSSVLVPALLQAQTPARAALPVPNLPGYITLKGDFHLHTVFSDGAVWPTVHVNEAWRDGLDVIALTEHAEYHPHRADVTVDAGRSYQLAKPLADQLGLILIPGIEITKPDPYTAPRVLPDGSAHFNALFVTDPNALNVPDLYEALRRARAQNAFVFWDHPRFRVQRAVWFPQIAKAFDDGLFAGMELVNGADFYDEAFPWVAQRRLTILANSDAHVPTPPRVTGHRRPLTLLFVTTRDEAGVRDALQQRRTAAWLGDDLWGDETFLKGIWDGAISVQMPAGILHPGAVPILRFTNTSAISMTLRVLESPSWITPPDPIRIDAQTETLVSVPLERSAPVGRHEVPLIVEVTNLHTAPGRQLVVRLPMSLEIRQRTQP